MIWDGIRALDYLAARPDLDPNRIGCAGHSGGGMMTSYLMALVQGISVQAGAGASREDLQKVAEAVLAIWPGR